jgi:hypothetical protein
MDLRTQQDLEYLECEKHDKELMEKRDKQHREEFYKSMFAEPKKEEPIQLTEEEPIQLTKEELRIKRLLFFEKKIDLNKPS